MEGSVYQYYANVRTEPVEWLWYPYIPLGKLTVLQGDPGEGKSTFALNVVARITTGQPMPDGVPAKESVLRSISVLKTVLQIQ